VSSGDAQEPATLDVMAPQHVHVVAVGGSAMSGIARVLAGLGHRVTGSDIAESARLASVRAAGVDVYVGHDAAHVGEHVDVVVASSAIGDDNPEVRRARELGIPVLRRADAQRAIVRTRRSVAVAGSHGKTTTSSMLTLVLEDAGWEPSFLVGGDVASLGATAALRAGEWLVVEADESDGTFLELGAEAAIVTSVEPDHLGHYGGLAALEDAFRRFVAGVPGPRVLCLDDTATARLAAQTPHTVGYGFTEGADYRITEYEGAADGSRIRLAHREEVLGPVELGIPGRHNATNAAGAAAMALELGVPFDAVQRGLARFGGLARRFQRRGVRDGVTYVDDYAHLPTEVAAMVGAAREGGWARVVVVFQPHRYSRTADLWRDFADAFVGADLLVLTDVYAFNEPVIHGVSGRLVLRAVLDAHPEQPAVYLPARADLARHVPLLTRPGDLVLTLGAGDLTELPDVWLGAA
jgi:UDP-N-acetylmuramate--alanine ligase